MDNAELDLGVREGRVADVRKALEAISGYPSHRHSGAL